jgi:hypothetical protein
VGKPPVNLAVQPTHFVRLSTQIHDLKQRADYITMSARGLALPA